MKAPIEPRDTAELLDVVRSCDRVIAVGARTKPRLSRVDDRYVPISMRYLAGIVEYEPDEYTITALAGTPLAVINAALARKGQYLPFDPPFALSGATLGGAIAADTNGPGRFRFGGVRDFILGVRFIDGEGRLLRVGGKVVKNAAGFDVPKFLVGSLGRFGILSEATLKVLPRPISTRTLRLHSKDLPGALRMVSELGTGRWQPDALEIPGPKGTLHVRLAGPEAALSALSSDILQRWPGEVVTQVEAAAFWADLAEVGWGHPGGALVRIATSNADLVPFVESMGRLPETRVHIGAGGNIVLVSLPSIEPASEVDRSLRLLSLSGVAWRGLGPLWLGKRPSTAIAVAVKAAFDRQGRFPGLDD